MGRHVNPDVEVDALPASALPASAFSAPPAPPSAPMSAPAGHPLEPQAVISADTHVGVDFDALAAGTRDAAPSPADPDALIRHGLVGDGTELE